VCFSNATRIWPFGIFQVKKKQRGFVYLDLFFGQPLKDYGLATAKGCLA
jgi:hypothetical protein